MIREITGFLERRTKRSVCVLAIVLSIILFIVDLATGIEMHFLLFYLIPIFLGSWFVSRETGVYLAVFVSLIWLITDTLSGRVYSAPWVAYWNLLMRTGVFVIFALTQASLKAKLDELSSLANRDFLTGLPNSRAFYQLAAEEMNRATSAQPMTLACIDVSGLQLVNERFGYPAGDQMICSITHTILQNAARPDLVGRTAGTTFAVLLPNTAATNAGRALEEIHSALKDERRKFAHPLNFYISAVACTKTPRTVAELMREADGQMLRMKNAKKDFIQVVTTEGGSLLN